MMMERKDKKMKYNYDFRILESRGKHKLQINMPKNMEIISVFLSYDVQSRPESVYRSLDKVLNGESEYEEWNGNICGLEIKKEFTTVLDNLADDGKGNWCEIETSELRELIDIWITELKQFKQESSNM